MPDMLAQLAWVIEQSITGFAARHPGCRFGLDCNTDYGAVNIAVNTTPQSAPLDAFLTGDAQDFYRFGDWAICDLAMHDREVAALWRQHWEPHERAICQRQDSAFAQACFCQLLMQGVCRIAADLSGRLKGIEPPILAADHDEHMNHTTARLRWALQGPPSPGHAALTQHVWTRQDEQVAYQLGFFHSGQYIEHATFLDDATVTIETDGEWRLAEKNLVMTLTYTNWKRLDNRCWQEVPLSVQVLTDGTLEYRDDDGEVFIYQCSPEPIAGIQ